MRTILDMTFDELMDCGVYKSIIAPKNEWYDRDTWKLLPREEVEERVKSFLRVKNTGLEGAVDI